MLFFFFLLKSRRLACDLTQQSFIWCHLLVAINYPTYEMKDSPSSPQRGEWKQAWNLNQILSSCGSADTMVLGQFGFFFICCIQKFRNGRTEYKNAYGRSNLVLITLAVLTEIASSSVIKIMTPLDSLTIKWMDFHK